MPLRAPNRVLDLEELAEPFFAETVAALQALAAKDPVSYLHPSKQWEYPWALERAGLSPGMRVLDAGCGASIFPVFLAGKGYHTAACDLDVPAQLPGLHNVAIDYVRNDLTTMPFRDSAFEAVFCISVIEHLPPAAVSTAMVELHRVLVPGGRLLLTTDYYKQTDGEIYYCGPGRPFRVDWNLFDRDRLDRFIFSAPGFAVLGDVDLRVDWGEVSPRMERFHGYPYTSVGISLEKMS